MEISLDAGEIEEGLSESELKSRYEAAGRKGTHEDLSREVEKEMKRRKTGQFPFSLF